MVPVEICASRGEDRNATSEHSRPKRRIGALQAGVWSPSVITTDRPVGARSIHLLTVHGKGGVGDGRQSQSRAPTADIDDSLRNVRGRGGLNREFEDGFELAHALPSPASTYRGEESSRKKTSEPPSGRQMFRGVRECSRGKQRDWTVSSRLSRIMPNCHERHAMKLRHTAALTLAVTLAVGLPIAADWPASERVDLDAVYRIKDEGLQRSKVMDIESWLTD